MLTGAERIRQASASGELANLILIDDMVNVHSVILEGTLAVHKGDLLV